MNLREMLQRRAQLIAQARAILDKGQTEGRDLTTEEDTNYKAAMKDVTKMSVDIERRQALELAENEAARTAASAGRGDPEDAPGDQRGQPPQTGRASASYRAAFRSYLNHGLSSLTGEEIRALQADNNSLGGFLYTPLETVNSLIMALNNQVFMRRMATRYEVQNSESLGIPTLGTDVSDPIWTTELATGDEDSAMAFGRRDLKPQPLAKRIKVSNKLLRKVPNAEQLVVDRLTYKFGIAEENAFLNGNGTLQPLGVFTASANGIPTARDVSTGNTSTAITFDGLTAAKYFLKAGYRPKAQWIFHRNAIEQLAKIKDTTGQYIWRESVRVGEPELILGLPMNMSEYAPNTFTTGLYVGIIGDFSNYTIADSVGTVEIQRLTELYAETNQIGLIGRKETDGMPTLAEAFARVKLA